jgi:argininosuccinate lyase
LGAGALAGSSLPLDPAMVAEELGFDHPFENSLDAVSDRDFVAEALFIAALVQVHLSRLGEEIVLWSTEEFGFVRLADAYSTGSSMLPQKKNPDIAELLRGRAGRSLGGFVALATVLKGLPLAYDRDLQEDKAALFAAVENTLESVEAADLLVRHLVFDRERLAEAAADPLLLATDVAEDLVRGGMPFRQAHETVGRQVRDGTFEPSSNARASIARRRLDVGRRAKVIRREAAALRR